MHTPILVVGGSLVGLSASLFLGWHGVPHILIDKHPGSSPHPRAMGFTETTLEHYRAVGIADQIPQVPAGTRLRRVTVDSLAGDWRGEQAWTPGEAPQRQLEQSPCTGAAIAQDRLEPILRAAAGRLPLRSIDVGSEVLFPPSQSFADVYGVPASGATLVRPDGVIGWRSLSLPDEDGVEALSASLFLA